MSVAIGIDLGTTNTAVAAVVDGVATTLADEQGRRLLPSVVSFHPSGTVLVGDGARERRLIDPENTIYSIKPLIGRAYDSEEVTAARGRFPFELVPGSKQSTMVHARGVDYALPEISAFVLRRAKAIAEASLQTTVDRAVITVPANFNDLQRASTKIAGKLAGLDVMRILNEPTAAALAYGQSIAKAEKIAVYDLGGGTFDVTLLDLTGNVFEVLATAGDTALGGDDLDRILAERIAVEITRRFNLDPRTNPTAMARLKFIAEDVKKALSVEERVTHQIGDIGYGADGMPITMPFLFSRPELERLVLPLVERTIGVVKQSIEIIGLSPSSFDRVILVGGSTRMPLVGRLVQQVFGKPAHDKVNPDEVVALGAAIQAHALNRAKPKKREGAPMVRPITTPEGFTPPGPPPAAAPGRPGKPPPPKGARAVAIPAPPPGLGAEDAPPSPPGFGAFSKSAAVITFSPPPAGMPPEESVPIIVPPPAAVPATGARRSELDLEGPGTAIVPAPPSSEELAAQGRGRVDEGSAAFTLELDDVGRLAPSAADYARGSAVATKEDAPLLIDVTPLSLRVETVGGYCDAVIDANTPVPCEKTRSFLTASDRQTTVTVRVAQGESARFKENTYLGVVELSGLRAARRGEVKVAVTFELDPDGILKVRAKDAESGTEARAEMRLLGTATDDASLAEMRARQARHAVA